MSAICCYAAELTQSSALALTLQPLLHRIASLSLLPQCNEHTMKWLGITDGASRDLSILIFSHSAGREMHWYIMHWYILQRLPSCSPSSSSALLCHRQSAHLALPGSSARRCALCPLHTTLPALLTLQHFLKPTD